MQLNSTKLNEEKKKATNKRKKIKNMLNPQKIVIINHVKKTKK